MAFHYDNEGLVTRVAADSNVKEELEKGFYTTKIQSGMFGSNAHMSVGKAPVHPHTIKTLFKEYVNIEHLMLRFSKESDFIFDALNMNKQYNFLFEGMQGCGKTAIMYYMAQLLHDKLDAYVFTVETKEALEFCVEWVKMAKEEKDFLSVIIFDECEDYMCFNESNMKKTLDGYEAIPNNIWLFATNNIDDIPDTIRKRPSRIHEEITVKGIESEELVFFLLNDMNEELPESVKLLDEQLRGITPEFVGRTIDEIKTAFLNSVLETHLSALEVKALV